ncbi:L,D-transpeptidase family protein [Parafrigoribacterium mesophilum]|uniref:L,D-transpeptidase family protein n=1 Tax=Parafrigoribacterium mesophilum TaxID=433646 RepID=UPI0031FDDC7B
MAIAVALALAGCTSQELHPPIPHASSAPAPITTAPAPSALAPSVVGDAAVALTNSVAVYTEPRGSLLATFANPQRSGAPLTFLVVGDDVDGWLKVEVPQRPNGSTGWVSATSVSLQRLVYSLRVSTQDNTLSLFKDSVLVTTYSVATGTGGTPTPHGSFYLTELLQPTNDGYGPYAFGLSAYSEVLSDFGGGPGQIGLHGTDDAASIGRAASHGCIRMSNADIAALAALLPLGTPIVIE